MIWLVIGAIAHAAHRLHTRRQQHNPAVDIHRADCQHPACAGHSIYFDHANAEVARRGLAYHQQLEHGQNPVRLNG